MKKRRELVADVLETCRRMEDRDTSLPVSYPREHYEARLTDLVTLVVHDPRVSNIAIEALGNALYYAYCMGVYEPQCTPEIPIPNENELKALRDRYKSRLARLAKEEK